MTFPIPDAAMDDRLGILGTSGSGKTYSASTAVERLLDQKARVVIVDPLGVWYGLRLMADGKTESPYNVAIFGGPHGDLPLTENSGALIGETAALIAESCIIDLSALPTKASEIRFMTAFLDSMYRKAKGDHLFHLIVDEADLFAPQKPGHDETNLLNRMEQIVRRGRVNGFIPWLITQRPAVINKNVLSMVRGLVAFAMTSSQDRAALDAWIAGQADETQGKAIKASLPTLKLGQGVVWLPSHGILKTEQFPLKKTFDSSRAPERGEKRKTNALKPLDLGALRERLSAVEAETKANDPKLLKAEVTKLKQQLAKAATLGSPSSPEDLAAAEYRGFERGFSEGFDFGNSEGSKTALVAAKERLLAAFEGIVIGDAPTSRPSRPAPSLPPQKRITPPVAPKTYIDGAVESSGLSGPQQRILDAIAWWRAAGNENPKRVQVAFVSGYKPGTGTFNTYLGQLSKASLINYPRPGYVALTDAGWAKAASDRIGAEDASAAVRAILTGPQNKLLEPLLRSYPKPLSRSELAERAGYQPNTGTFNTYLGQLSTLEIVEYPERGMAVAADWLFEERA